jgi:hypothetical protein
MKNDGDLAPLQKQLQELLALLTRAIAGGFVMAPANKIGQQQPASHALPNAPTPPKPKLPTVPKPTIATGVKPPQVKPPAPPKPPTMVKPPQVGQQPVQNPKPTEPKPGDMVTADGVKRSSGG